MRIFCLSMMLVLLPASAFAKDFELDRGMGDESTGRGAGGGIEGEMDLSQVKRGYQNGRANVQTDPNSEASTLATAVGNLITIHAETGSAVTLNAVQYNKGNQTVTVNQLKGFGGKPYNNVTDPTTLSDGNSATSSGNSGLSGGYSGLTGGNSALSGGNSGIQSGYSDVTTGNNGNYSN